MITVVLHKDLIERYSNVSSQTRMDLIWDLFVQDRFLSMRL